MRRPSQKRRAKRTAGRSSRTAPGSVGAELAAYFARNGYVRWQDRRRLSREGHELYKKGSEVRLTARTRRELDLIRRLLRQAGFAPARPFLKGRQYRQPVYGVDEVERFLKLVAPHGITD